MSSNNPFAVIAADVQAFIAKVKADLQWFGTEFEAVVAWVDKSIPGAQQALAALFQVLDQNAQTLETLGEQGLQDVVANAVDEAGTTAANLLQASGLNLGAKTALNAGDVQAITTAHAIAQGAISTALAKILGTTAADFNALVASNAAAKPPA